MCAANQPATEWWQTFFDDEYAHIWNDTFSETETESQRDALWKLLQLGQGSRVLDAGCGYGRLSLPLAKLGAVIVGVDQSLPLLALAERNRGSVPETQLRYVHHDLRSRLNEAPFDAAFNVFTGIGYGREEDDLAFLSTLHDALRPGCLLLLETIQRDAVVAFIARGGQQARRRADGILVLEETSFDPIEGRINGTWYWAGAGISGQKSASIRVYAVTELIRLLERAGFQMRSAHSGVSVEPFKSEPPHMGGRVGLLVARGD